MLDLEHLRLRDLSLINNQNLGEKTLENTVIVGISLEDLASNLKQVVPVKPFEGRKKDHVLKYLQEYLCERIVPSEDVRSTIQQEFLS